MLLRLNIFRAVTKLSWVPLRIYVILEVEM